jgi:hypothetical protein
MENILISNIKPITPVAKKLKVKSNYHDLRIITEYVLQFYFCREEQNYLACKL